MNPNFIACLVMYSFPLISVAIFKRYQIRTAILLVFIGGFILLPYANLNLPHIPYQKLNALGIGLTIGLLSRDSTRILAFRPSLADLPMICWTLSPFFTSLSNQLGAYDGLNGIEYRITNYAIPYVAGRIYFGSELSLRDLAVGMVLGGLFLAPFVLVEIKISPQFHSWVYGFYPHEWSETKREGGFRPSVFMSHGLELAIFNAGACFLGWQLFLRKMLPDKIPLIKIPWVGPLALMTVGFIGSRSGGAIMLCLVCFGIIWIGTKFRTKLPILIFGILPLIYPFLRGSQLWTGESLLNASASLMGPDRARSLGFRMLNENLLSQKANIRSLFGWGGNTRSYIKDEKGRIASVPDSKWIVAFGENGAFGVVSFWLVLFTPSTIFFLRRPPSLLFSNPVIPGTLFSLWCFTTLADDCFNDMNAPVILIAAGGLTTLSRLPVMASTYERSVREDPQSTESGIRII